MKRMSLSIPKEVEKKVIELKKTDEFCLCSYSEILRRLLEVGIINFNSDGAREKGA